MSLDALVASNTQKARTTACNAFLRFLEADGVDEQFVHECIERDPTGTRLVAVVDSFGLYLAFRDGKSGNPLAKSSVTSYHGQVKNWLIDCYNSLRALVEVPLLKKGKTLEQYCMKREAGGYVNKAPGCTKSDLRCIMHHEFSRARNATDYQDAALMCLMRHSFGRAPDLGFVQKQHLTVSASGVFYMRILRVKTSQEQGLTLVPDKDEFLTCPLFALAAALVMQDAPSPALLTQLPALVAPPVVAADPMVPLRELLNADPADPADPAARGTTAGSTASREATPSARAPRQKTSKLGDIGIHGYVDRLLRRIDLPDQATQDLTSHSFRRGGAQHANGDDRLAPQWIFDRGAWNLSTMNKGFAYVFNTPREDRKVARVLSGWQPDDSPVVANISTLDHPAQEQLERFRASLFNSSSGLADTRLNVCKKVLSVLTAYVVRYFPQAKALNPDAPLIKRVEQRAALAGVSMVELLAWSVALRDIEQQAPTNNNSEQDKATAASTVHHGDGVIMKFIAVNRRMAERLRDIEAALLDKRAAATCNLPSASQETEEVSSSAADPPAKRQKAASTHLSDVWYAWYANLPRGWDETDRRKKSDHRLIVGFMKLFLASSFDLRNDAPDYKDRVLEYGRAAEVAALAFLCARQIKAKGAGTVLRKMRDLHRSGVLNERIAVYKLLLQTERINDPSPVSSHDMLAPRHT